MEVGKISENNIIILLIAIIELLTAIIKLLKTIFENKKEDD